MGVTYNGKIERERELFKNILEVTKHLAGKFEPRGQFTLCCGPKTCDGPSFVAPFLFYFY